MRFHVRADAAFSMLYVAFVFAGVYKSAWYLAWIPVDLTLVFGSLMIVVGGWLVLQGRVRRNPAERNVHRYPSPTHRPIRP